LIADCGLFEISNRIFQILDSCGSWSGSWIAVRDLKLETRVPKQTQPPQLNSVDCFLLTVYFPLFSD
jgi:hypothetical protein